MSIRGGHVCTSEVDMCEHQRWTCVCIRGGHVCASEVDMCGEVDMCV